MVEDRLVNLSLSVLFSSLGILPRIYVRLTGWKQSTNMEKESFNLLAVNDEYSRRGGVAIFFRNGEYIREM